jgi:hypothetical protein
LDYLIDGAMMVFLWRGHHPMGFCGKLVLVPAHLITAFTSAMIISYDFNAFFSFVFFAIGWAMLAVNHEARQNPCLWHKCADYKTF